MIDNLINKISKKFYSNNIPEITYNKRIGQLKYNSSGLKDYQIIKNPSKKDMYDFKGWLIIDGAEYIINWKYNINNFIKGDNNAADYIFRSVGFNVRDFEIRDKSNEIK